MSFHLALGTLLRPPLGTVWDLLEQHEESEGAGSHSEQCSQTPEGASAIEFVLGELLKDKVVR